jgi:hypothetical protein
VEQEFISSEDMALLDEVLYVPRTAEFIWIYQKLTEFCKDVNSKYYQFQLSGFGSDLHVPQEEDWILSIDRGEKSTNKLNLILWRGSGVLEMNHGEYKVEGKRGAIMIFPAYLWWKTSGDFLTCTLSGNHFS